jgi:hypothetical protein
LHGFHPCCDEAQESDYGGTYAIPPLLGNFFQDLHSSYVSAWMQGMLFRGFDHIISNNQLGQVFKNTSVPHHRSGDRKGLFSIKTGKGYFIQGKE